MRDTRLPCSCGEPLQNCEFWSRVRERVRAGGNLDAIDMEASKHPDFADWNVALFESLLTVSGRSVVCDSSKNYGRLSALIESGRFDISVVHLVRDARAVAWSYKTKGARSEKSADHYDFDKALDRWNAVNRRMIDRLSRANVPLLTVRYEDLVADTPGTVARALALHGLEYESGQERYWQVPQHLAAGNRMRFAERPTIEFDGAYLEGLDDAEWDSASRRCATLLSHFGYPLQRNRSNPHVEA